MLLSQVKFAEYIGVHKATVSKMKKRRELVMQGKKVDVEKTIELLRSIGKTFDVNNKMISSNTLPGTIEKQEENIFDVDPASYPTLSADEKKQQAKQLLEREMEQQAQELGLKLSDIQTPEIEAMEKWEVERFKIFYQGMLERAKYFKEIGQLVDVEEVREEQFTIARTVRDAVMSMSNRIAHKLINKTEMHEVKLILDAEALKVMENLSL